MALEHFGTRIFQHIDILTQGTRAEISVPKCLCCFERCQNVHCQNTHAPKCFSAMMFLCQNVHGAKIYPCQNVVVPKCPRAEKSPWWNVRAEMSLAEMSGAQISPCWLQLFSFGSVYCKKNEKSRFVYIIKIQKQEHSLSQCEVIWLSSGTNIETLFFVSDYL